ncbi:MAG: hypothetical protein R2839_12075 [Thermomicrobiales bacterium]
MADTTAQGQFEALHRLQDAAIAAARTSGPPNYSGDGMVIVAGGGRYFVNAFVALTVLRNDVACQLPIQIWYLGPHEMSDAMKALLTPSGCRIGRRQPGPATSSSAKTWWLGVQTLRDHQLAV